MKIFVAVVALVTVFFLGVAPQASAQEGTLLEGTWKLVMRKLADGTTQVPPAVQGAATWHSGLRNLVVLWHTPEGKPVLVSGIFTYKMSGTEYTETLLVFALDDGSGKPPTYNLTGGTKTVPVTRDGPRIAFQPPFDPVSFVFEGDKWTATSEKPPFVDHWERVR
jgi:hypothetical protein